MSGSGNSQYSAPPEDPPRDQEPAIWLRDVGLVPLTPPLVEALRVYVSAYIRAHGRRVFREEFSVPVRVLRQWESGEAGFTIPLRTLQRLGTDPHDITAAAEELGDDDSGVCEALEDTESEEDAGWETYPWEVESRHASFRALTPDERARYGEGIAFRIEHRAGLREIVARRYLNLSPSLEREVPWREMMLASEVELLQNGVTVLGGGSGHRVDNELWNDEGVRAEIKWREDELEARRARQTPLWRRLFLRRRNRTRR